MANLWGNNWNSDWLCFLGLQITADGDCSHEIKRCLLLGRKAMTNLDSILKSRHYFTNKGPSNQSYGFSSGHVWMWELDCKESWMLKNWCFWTVVLKTLESPLDCKEIQPVHPKGNQSWMFIGKTDAEAETPILWPPDVKNWLIGEDPDDEDLERLKVGGDGDNRGWDGWMASQTQWTWVWVSSGSWWLTGRPGMLQSTRSQRVGHDWVTELNWTELIYSRARTTNQLCIFLLLPFIMDLRIWLSEFSNFKKAVPY